VGFPRRLPQSFPYPPKLASAPKIPTLEPIHCPPTENPRSGAPRTLVPRSRS
jgi:hypothetical protein